jgi:PAS domain S-box-containing protein
MIEDSHADFLLIERHLKRYGLDAKCIRIDTLEAVQQALALCRWDIVLCDYSIPGVEFDQILGLVRGRLSDVPVILVSGCVGETRAVDLLRQGVSDFILKDNLARLGPAIERSLQDVCDRRARQAAESALRESEDRLRRVFEVTNDGLWDWDVASGKAVLSPRCYDMTGYQPGDVEPGLEFFKSIVHPDDLPRVLEFVDTHCCGDAPAAEVDCRIVTRSGAIMWVKGKGRAVNRDATGKPLRVVGTIVDITARRAAEETLLLQADRLRHLLQTASDGIHILDQRGNLILASDSFYHMLGYDEDIPPAMHVTDWEAAMTPDELSDIIANLTAEPKTFSTRHRRRDGTVFDVEISTRRVLLDGQVLLFASSRDITERKRTDQEFHNLLTYQRAILGNSPIGIAILDLDRHFVETNDAFCRIFGRQGEDLTGQSICRLYADPALYDSIGQRAYPRIRQGQTFSEDIPMCRCDGSAVWVRLVGHLVDEDNHGLGVVWVAEDITDRKVLEEELRRSNAELEQFAYVASHDLRQPLRMVSSYLRILEKTLGPRLEGEEKTVIGFAIDGARRMDRMIIDLLEYSRIGHDGAEAKIVALDEVMVRAVGSLQAAIDDVGAQVGIPPALPAVRGYASELERLFQNLISNAIKFRDPGRPPKVTVECLEMAREWIIAISDNGIGIAPENHARLFGIFQRLVSREQYEGTGIGLAACRKIIEHHGGRIWIDSQVGQGSTFFVAFPAIGP